VEENQGVTSQVIYQLLLSAAMCVVAAWLGHLLHQASLEPHGEHELDG